MPRAFGSIEVTSRPGKPRDRSITMLIDWGVGLRAVEDVLDLAAPFVDLGKVAVGISGILEETVLRRKIALYRRYEVDPFPGGMFLELAYRQGRVREYLRECVAVGYRSIEVSDNVVRFPPGEKEALVRRAREEFGLRVLGEVGRKRQRTSGAELVTGIEAALRAGCWKVFVEAAEFFDGKFKGELVVEVAGAVPTEALIFELPGKWLPDIHACQVHQMMVYLVDALGPDVNVGNVLPEDVVVLETLRRGVGVSMHLEDA